MNKEILQLVALIGSCTSFEQAQRLVSDSSNLIVADDFVAMLLNATSSNSVATQSTKLSNQLLARVLLSAILIVKYPREVLSDNNQQLQVDARNCLSKAENTANCLFKVFSSDKVDGLIDVINIAEGRIFLAALNAFYQSLESWRKSDMETFVASLEETYCQAYALIISLRSKVETKGGDDKDLVVAEQQLATIKVSLTQVLGEQIALNRIEELRAAVETAVFGNTDSSPAPKLLVSSEFTDAAVSPKISYIGLTDSDFFKDIFLPSDGVVPDTSLKFLRRLSQLSGIDEERLVYEMTLDPFYRLPVSETDVFSDDDSGKRSIFLITF
jgi:hypothetical protein